MGIEQQLTDTLTRAIKDKDTQTANAVRMLKTKLQERRTAKGFSGTVDDALVLDVVGAYRKQLQKALAEYEKAGRARGRAGRPAPLRDRVLRALPAARDGRGRAARPRARAARRARPSPIPSRWAAWSATS